MENWNSEWRQDQWNPTVNVFLALLVIRRNRNDPSHRRANLLHYQQPACLMIRCYHEYSYPQPVLSCLTTPTTAPPPIFFSSILMLLILHQFLQLTFTKYTGPTSHLPSSPKVCLYTWDLHPSILLPVLAIGTHALCLRPNFPIWQTAEEEDIYINSWCYTLEVLQAANSPWISLLSL